MTEAPVRTWLWMDELAQETGIPPGTLRHWRLTRRGPRSYLIGRRVAYDREDVQRWLRVQRDAARP